MTEEKSGALVDSQRYGEFWREVEPSGASELPQPAPPLGRG